MFAAGDGLGFEWPAVTASTDYSGPHAPGKSSLSPTGQLGQSVLSHAAPVVGLLPKSRSRSPGLALIRSTG
jgi:hypothetical protein